MLTEILSGGILIILAFIALVACLIAIVTIIGNASYYTKPYTEALENKQERIAFLKTIVFLGGLLLLCKYV